MTTNAIIANALKLPLKKRGELLGRLLESLEGPAETRVEELWEKEISRRLELMRAGKLKMVDGDKALARLKRKYPF